MSHNKTPEFGFFKFTESGDDTYTITHNLDDLRPVVEVYNDDTDVRINDAVITVIDNNSIEIELTGTTDIRGTIVGFPEPSE